VVLKEVKAISIITKSNLPDADYVLSIPILAACMLVFIAMQAS